MGYIFSWFTWKIFHYNFRNCLEIVFNETCTDTVYLVSNKWSGYLIMGWYLNDYPLRNLLGYLNPIYKGWFSQHNKNEEFCICFSSWNRCINRLRSFLVWVPRLQWKHWWKQKLHTYICTLYCWIIAQREVIIKKYWDK